MPDPFTPREREGRLYGRGALDIKSGVAAICAAAIAARDAGVIQKPLLIAAVVDEECDSIGTEALLKRYTADAAIVIEPTDLRLTIAHKGYAWFEIVTHGRAAHGSLPSEGRDAIRMMGRVLNILDALDRKLASLTPHPLLGHGSLHASVIRGGQEFSSYPAECRLQLERRMLPEESAGEFEVELRSSCRRACGSRSGFSRHGARARLASGVRNFSRRTDRATRQQRDSENPRTDAAEQFVGMAAWTDTALLAEAGIPGIVFGPTGRGLHGKEEYVELDSVVQCSEILLEAIRSACSQ